MLKSIIVQCESNRKLFSIILPYLFQLRKSGINPNEKVKRRTVRMRHHLNTILISGIKNNEFKTMNVKYMNDLLYSIIEAAIFRISVLNQSDIDDIYGTLNLAIDGFVNN